MARFPRWVLAVAGVGLLLGWLQADTLRLKDGQVLQGRYMGGTRNNISFQVDGQVEPADYPVSQVSSITFGAPAAAAAAAPPRRSLETRPPTTLQAPNLATSTDRITVPAGTRLLVRMIDSIDSDRNRIGDRFRGMLQENLVVEGRIVAPKGTDVYGRLAEAREAGRLAGRSELKLELTDMVLNNQPQPIMASPYEVAGKGRGGNTAAKTAGGAAVGAVIGGIAGGGRGAAIGAGVGGGAGAATNVITRGERVRVPSETLIEFTIQQPFTVQPPPGE
jgi:hypothetical protein